MPAPGENRSTSDLVGDLLSEVTTLFRKEIQLARTEMSEKVSQAIAGVGSIVVGAVLLMASLVILLQAAVGALERYADIQTPWAELIVAGLVLLIGFIMLRMGLSSLSLSRLAPSKTVDQIQRDAAVVREQAQ